MKNKKLIWTIFIIQAIPIPISFISIIGSLVSFANISILVEKSMLLAAAATLAMFFAGTYSVTYIFALIKTINSKRITFISFLPVLHILLFVLFFNMWVIFEDMYM